MSKKKELLAWIVLAVEQNKLALTPAQFDRVMSFSTPRLHAYVAEKKREMRSERNNSQQ